MPGSGFNHCYCLCSVDKKHQSSVCCLCGGLVSSPPCVKGWCLENADMELTITLLPIKLASGRTEVVQMRQGFCAWVEEISFLISLIFSWWWLTSLWNINPALYNLPSFYSTMCYSLTLPLLSPPQWNNDTAQTNDSVPHRVYNVEKDRNCSPLENPFLLTHRQKKSIKI